MSLSTQRPRGTSVVNAALARDRLGVPSVVFFVISAAAPLTVIAGVISTAYAETGLTGVPLAFILLGAISGVFAVGYVTMARHILNAGAFYAYTAQGLGRPAGVATAWVALLAYNSLQVALYGVIGAAAEPLLVGSFGAAPPWWVIALVGWLITGVLGLLRVDLNGKVLAVLLITEIAVVVIFDVTNLAHPAATGYDLTGFAPANLFAPGIGAVFAISVASFAGFESSVVFAEETKDPQRTVPVATYVSLAIISGLYALSAWAMAISTGPDQIVAASRDYGPGLLFGLAEQHLGPAMSTIGSTLFVTSILAAMVAFHNTIARYVFALGRERVLPAACARTTARTGAPVIGSAIQTIIGLITIVVFAVAGWDPLAHLFFAIGSFGGLGVLAMLAATSVAVICYFDRASRLTVRGREPAWRVLYAPLIAAVLLLVVFMAAVLNFGTVIGAAPGAPLRWILPTLYAVAIVAGLVWARVLSWSHPDIYAGIGRGAHASALGATR